MNKPDAFVLNKCKLVTGGGLSVDYRSSEQDDQQTFNEKNAKISSKVPHPDLQKALDKLKDCSAQVAKISSIEAVRTAKQLNAEQVKAFKVLKPIIDKMMKENMEDIRVTGVAISGDDKARAVIITGTIEVNSGARIAINSPRILLSGDAFGFEAILEKQLDKVVHEVEQYLFEGKKGDMELFDPVAEKEEG